MAEVVRLEKAQKRIDLRGDNRLPALLDERDRLKAEMKDLQDRLKELDSELLEKLGDAHQMVTDGWLVKRLMYIRKEYTVKSATISRILIRRAGKRIHSGP